MRPPGFGARRSSPRIEPGGPSATSVKVIVTLWVSTLDNHRVAIRIVRLRIRRYRENSHPGCPMIFRHGDVLVCVAGRRVWREAVAANGLEATMELH